jgi:hypothetical protein
MSLRCTTISKRIAAIGATGCGVPAKKGCDGFTTVTPISFQVLLSEGWSLPRQTANAEGKANRDAGGIESGAS